MKNLLKSLMSVAAAALALTSCSNDATEEVTLQNTPKPLAVNASIDQTRTSLADNHIDLKWSEGDSIYLYIGETAAKKDVIKYVIGDQIKATYNDGDNVYANYSPSNYHSDGVSKAQIYIYPKQYQTEANVFAGKNLPMVAKGKIANSKVDLTFQPVGCVLVFNVYGPTDNDNEKIKEIQFETSVDCCGYQNCDLTAEDLGYIGQTGKTWAKAILDTPAAISASKPNDTRIGENQIYLVVAPFNYTDAKIIVTMDNEDNDVTYKFTTANGIDCSGHTARVVNLNLEKAKLITAPKVGQLPSEGGDFSIENITFEHISAEEIANAEVGVYEDAELTQSLGDDAWLAIVNSNLTDGQLNCRVATNTNTEDRTAYISIKCGGAQAVIAITQVASGASTEPVIIFEENFDFVTGGGNTATIKNDPKNPTGTTPSDKAWNEKPTSPNFDEAINVYDAGGAIKLGASKKTGSITTKKLDLSAPFTLEFKVKGWATIENKINILVDGQVKETVSYTATIYDNFEPISIKLDAATASSSITIATTAKRAFIDDIVIKK